MTNAAIKLEACMSCLSEDVDVYGYDGWYGALCNDCPAEIRPTHRSIAGAVAQWNGIDRPQGYQRKFPTPNDQEGKEG
jgi:hypothetical protein